jgi:hypothetical protein
LPYTAYLPIVYYFFFFLFSFRTPRFVGPVPHIHTDVRLVILVTLLMFLFVYFACWLLCLSIAPPPFSALRSRLPPFSLSLCLRTRFSFSPSFLSSRVYDRCVCVYLIIITLFSYYYLVGIRVCFGALGLNELIVLFLSLAFW